MPNSGENRSPAFWPVQEGILLTYYAGIFNGNGRNITVNDNNKLYVCRSPGVTAVERRFWKVNFLSSAATCSTAEMNRGSYLAIEQFASEQRRSLSPFTLPSADERTAWSVDACEMGPFDLIGEYLQEHVEGRTVNGVPPAFSNFTTDGFYVTGAYYFIPKKLLQAVVQWQDPNPGQRGNDGPDSILGGLNYSTFTETISNHGQLCAYLVGFPPSES